VAPPLAGPLEAAARELLAANGGRAGCLRFGSSGSSLVVLVEPDPDEPAMVVFGAGHVGRALVAILATLPGRVTWSDARPDAFADAVPHGVDCRVVSSPEDEVDDAPAGASFVVLTHDHALDLRLAETILGRGDFDYFGLIGSATKRGTFIKRFKARGIPQDAIDRMVCPIGVPGLSGKHPGEIAVAVAAQLLQIRESRASGA
jgi:xanthine dehydrogenase accessory factor